MHPATRRTFLRTSGLTLAGGSAVFLAACGGARHAVGPSGGSADVDILNSALDLENSAIAVYRTGAGLLGGDVLRTSRRLLTQEEAHAAELRRVIGRMGGTPHEARRSYAGVFPRLSSPTRFLEFADMIENQAVAAYVDAVPRLSDPALRATAAAILTNEAEHVTILRMALGRRPVPAAFMDGQEG